MDRVTPIHIGQARRFVAKHHYNKTMPRLTKLCVGGFSGERLVAICTFGYGVRPVHTLANIFPTLSVSNYLEIGRLCVDDAIPRNGESWFMSRAFKVVRNTFDDVKILYSWSDGIVGKPGYVYQASNFYYGGYIWTEMYLSEDGNRVHPRTMQGISCVDGRGKFHSRDYETTRALGYTKYFGLQFRYVYPLCSRREWKKLSGASPIDWSQGNYPKSEDCKWMVQVDKGVRVECNAPRFVSSTYVREDLPLFTEAIR